MKYWLIKSEPGTWSWDDQTKAKGGRTAWDGVRNAQACIHLRAMAVGDRAFFYHSGKDKAIVGVVEIVKAAYPDPSDDTGRAVMVDVKAIEPVPDPVTLKMIKSDERLAGLAVQARQAASAAVAARDEAIREALAAEASVAAVARRAGISRRAVAQIRDAG